MKKSFSLNDIGSIAKDILEDIDEKELKNSCLITMSGDLGTGKTTLTQEIAKILKVKEKVVSPTFVIIKKYKIIHKKFKRLIHIDAYRLDNSEELLKIGWEDIIKNKENMIILEWPEKVEECIKEATCLINLEHKNEKTRNIETCYN